MSVDNTATNQSFAMDGVTTAFTLTLHALQCCPTDIKAEVVNATGTHSTLAYDVDYTVDINVEGDGGTIYVTNPRAAGITLFAYRQTTNLQESDYEDFNQFPAATVESDFDRRTLKSQEDNDAINRAIKFNITSDISDIEYPVPVDGLGLKWSGTGGTIVNTELQIDSSSTLAASSAAIAMAAATTASIAATSATLSAASATSSSFFASSYATVASSYATSGILAGSYATICEDQAGIATTQATIATTQANIAITQATLAISAATAAIAQVTLAATSASIAETWATLAASSATVAMTQASIATTQATLAASSATVAADNAVFRNFWNGTFIETFDAKVVASGSNITMTLEQSGGGDLTMQFSDGNTTLDCTTPIQSIALTAGSLSVPLSTYVYITQANKVLELSNTDWPADEHIKVAYLLIQSAGLVATYSSLANQNWNDHLEGTNGQGHLSHITTKIRQALGATYDNGVAFSFTPGVVAAMGMATTAGVIDQMHPHTFAATTMPTDDIHVVNNLAAPYTTISDLTSIILDSAGGSLSNKFFNLVFFGVANKTGEEDHIMALLPSGSYNTETSAKDDVDSFTTYTIPSVYTHESSTGFFICEATFKFASGTGTLEMIESRDLRGRNPDSIVGGGAGTALTEFADTQFKIFDDGDSTKIMQFDAAGLDTGSVSTLSIPNKSGTIAYNDAETFGTISVTTSATIGVGTACTLTASEGTLLIKGVGGTNNDSMTIDLEDGSDTIVIGSGSGATKIKLDELNLLMEDNDSIRFGVGADLYMAWRATGNHNFQIGTRVGNSNYSGYICIMERGNMGNANRSPIATSTTPVFRVYAVGTTATSYIEKFYDDPNSVGVIQVGAGSLEIRSPLTTGTLAVTTTATIAEAHITTLSAATITVGGALVLPDISKSITIESAVTDDDITMFKVPSAATITAMYAVVSGTSPSANWVIKHGTDRSSGGSSVLTAGTTTTDITTGSTITVFSDATIAAGSWVWAFLPAVTGTVDTLNITLNYRMDP